MKYTKNYVQKHGLKLSKSASELGVGDDLIKRCIAGDERALRELGDKGNEGTRILTIIPYIRDNAAAFLQGTAEYNKTLADIYKNAGATGTAIDRASAQTAIANLKYGHERSETAIQLANNRTLENQRHHETLDLVKLKAFIDYHLSRVEHLYSQKSQYARPNNAQVTANINYETEKAKYLLTNGSEADLNDLPKKQYLTDGLVRKFRTLMSTFFE